MSIPPCLMDQVVTPKSAQPKNCNMQYEIFDLGNRQIIESPGPEAEIIRSFFVGNEETNTAEFCSPRCKVPLSIEPLCKVCCGSCGKVVRHEEAIYQPAG